MCKCTPSVVNLSVVYGANASFDFYLTDGYGRAIDITGQDVVFTVKDQKGGTQKIQKTNSTGEHSEPTKGVTTFSLTPSDWTGIQNDCCVAWVYEIRRKNGTDEYVHLEGVFTVEQEV